MFWSKAATEGGEVALMRRLTLCGEDARGRERERETRGRVEERQREKARE